jgi:hypothetical protein
MFVMGNWTKEFYLGKESVSHRTFRHVRSCTQQQNVLPVTALASVCFRVLSRDHTIAPDMELATPVSDLVSSSVCPSQWPGGSTDIQLLAGSPDSQVC